MNDLFGHVLHDVGDGDMVGITIRNQVNENDKPVGISFRRKDKLFGDVIWSVFESLPVEFQVQCSGNTGRKREFGEDARRFREKRDKV